MSDNSSKSPSTLRQRFDSDRNAGILMLSALALSLVWANSAAKPVYDRIHHIPIHVRVGELVLDRPLAGWVNEGLMVFFFLYVTLEIRKDLLRQSLRFSNLSLPVFGAIGGMLVPAAIYLVLNWDQPAFQRGWAIPTATDIVLLIGVLSLFGKNVPPGLKLLLVTLAVFDDLGAILIIAFFFSEPLLLSSIGVSAAVIAGLVLLNRFNISQQTPYVLLGVFLWASLQKSGIHPTLAGFAIGVAVPSTALMSNRNSTRELGLRSWVLFFIVPLFTFLNVGTPIFKNTTPDILSNTVFMGITVGLFVGKPLGVLSMMYLAIKARWAQLPPGVTWPHILGGALLTGIGFTMSLFITSLSFTDIYLVESGRAGILAGSAISAGVGTIVIILVGRRPNSNLIDARRNLNDKL